MPTFHIGYGNCRPRSLVVHLFSGPKRELQIIRGDTVVYSLTLPRFGVLAVGPRTRAEFSIQVVPGVEQRRPRLRNFTWCLKAQQRDEPFPVCGRCQRAKYCSSLCQKLRRQKTANCVTPRVEGCGITRAMPSEANIPGLNQFALVGHCPGPIL